VVVVQAAADIEHRLRIEHARPRARGAVAGVRAGAGESAVGRPAVLSIQTWIEDHRPHEAESIRHLILVAQRVVDLRVEAVGRLLTRLRLLVVVLAERRAGDVRLGNEREQAARDRANPLPRNLIVRERRAIVTAHVTGRRVVNPARHFAEVAVAHPQRRHGRADDVAVVVGGALIVAEVE
jgi:hypothetical protein